MVGIMFCKHPPNARVLLVYTHIQVYIKIGLGAGFWSWKAPSD